MSFNFLTSKKEIRYENSFQKTERTSMKKKKNNMYSQRRKMKFVIDMIWKMKPISNYGCNEVEVSELSKVCK